MTKQTKRKQMTSPDLPPPIVIKLQDLDVVAVSGAGAALTAATRIIAGGIPAGGPLSGVSSV